MKINISDIINKEQNKCAVVIGLGPSLTKHQAKIKSLPRDKYVLIGCNAIDVYTDIDVDYWCFANPNLPITQIYDRLNKKNACVLYASNVDLTPPEKVDELLTCTYLPYNQNHESSESIQNELFRYSNFSTKIYSAVTVASNMFIFALLMGCKTIYAVGLDLDYTNGYVNGFPSDQREIPTAKALHDIKNINDTANYINSKIYCVDNNLPISSILDYSTLP